MLTQSDHGTENYNITYAQTSMHQALDPELAGTLQHNFICGHTNIKPERAWGRLWDTWSGGFEAMLNEGIKNQWYNTNNLINRYVFFTCNFYFFLTCIVLPSAGLRFHTFSMSLTKMSS